MGKGIKFQKNKLIKLLFLLLLFLVETTIVLAQSNRDTLKEPENVSLVKLIATPEKYDGKRIQVIGYLHLEFEGNAVYLHEEDYKNSILQNSFWVAFSDKLTKKKTQKNSVTTMLLL